MGGLPDEFTIISEILRPLAEGSPAALGLMDDAAVFAPPAGRDLVLTKDAIVAGVHYFPGDPPAQIAQKLMRVNLSDLAAKGARPEGYLLALALGPSLDRAWLEAFADGLAADQAEFGIALFGGDTVASPETTVLTLTAIGSVPAGKGLLRAGAASGDGLFVSGSIGDAHAGLTYLEGGMRGLDERAAANLVNRYRLPQPRVRLGQALEGIASACVDVSDGLVADAGHLAEASGVSIEIDGAAIPLSEGGRQAVGIDPGLWTGLVVGGDDYELLFTVPRDKLDALRAAGEASDVTITEIGEVRAGQGVVVRDREGREIAGLDGGYRHFSDS